MSVLPRGGRLTRRTVLTVVGLVLLVGGCALGVFAWRSGRSTPSRAFSLLYPRYDTLIATVNATGASTSSSGRVLARCASWAATTSS